MSHLARKRLFYALCGVFVILGAAVVLYAQGWRIDPATGIVTKVGAIFVRSYPSSAAISLEGKAIENTSGFLSPGTLISGLLPGSYTLALRSAGYRQWSERADVFPSLVATFKYAVLVPEKGTAVATSVNATAIFPETSGDLLMVKSGGSIVWRGKTIGAGTVVDENGMRALVKGRDGIYRAYDLANGTTTNVSAILTAAGADGTALQNIVFDPSGHDIIFAETKTRIWEADTSSGTATLLWTASSGTILYPGLAAANPIVAWGTMDQKGASKIIAYDAEDRLILQTIPITGKIKKLAWVRDGLLGVLRTNGAFAAYDASNGTIKELALGVKDFSSSSDGTMIAFLEANGIEAISLTAADHYRLPLRNINDVTRVIWYRDKNHLFLVHPNQVEFLDLSDVALKNVISIALGTAPAYDEGANVLFLATPDGGVLRFDFVK